MKTFLSCAAIASLCLFAGCSSSKEIPIHGEITLDGKPIPGPGIIAFYAEPGTDSPHASAEFADGKYEIPAAQGPSTGKFRVEITWPKPTGKKTPSAEPGLMLDERVEALPARYNQQTELRVEISPSQNVHDFHLKS